MSLLLLSSIAPLVDLLKQILDIPIPQFGLGLVEKLLEWAYWIFGQLTDLLLAFQVLPDSLCQGRGGVNGRESFNCGFGMLDLHFAYGVALVGNLLFKKSNFVLELLIFLLEALVFVFEGDEFLKNVRDMFLGGRPCILFEFEIILQPLDFGLQVIDDDFVLAVDFGLVVLLAQVDSLVQLRDHAVCLPIQIVEVGVLLNVDARCVPLSYAVDHSLQVGFALLLRWFNYIRLTHYFYYLIEELYLLISTFPFYRQFIF